VTAATVGDYTLLLWPLRALRRGTGDLAPLLAAERRTQHAKSADRGAERGTTMTGIARSDLRRQLRELQSRRADLQRSLQKTRKARHSQQDVDALKAEIAALDRRIGAIREELNPE